MASNLAQSIEQQRLELIYRVSRELMARLDLADLLPRLLSETVSNLRASTGSLVVYNAEGGILHSAVMVGGAIQPDPDRLQAATLDHGLAGWVAAHREPALVPNTATDARWVQRPDDQLLGPKSAICVPLTGRERLVGVLTLVKVPEGAFGEDDLSLLVVLGGLAGIAIENARLFDLEQRRRQISLTLNDIGPQISASLDLAQVLSLVLDYLARVVRYDSASILLRNGNQLHVAAARGFANPAALQEVTFAGDTGPSARVVKQRRPLVLPDAQKDPDWQTGFPESLNIRGWIGAPLTAKDDVLGVLCVDSHQPGAYTDDDGQVVASFAQQAAIAVVNARLFMDGQRRLQALQALTEAAQAVNSTLQLDEILRQIVEHAQRVLNVEAASVALIEGPNLVYREAVGAAADQVRGKAIPMGRGIVGWVAEHNQSALVPDVARDPRFFRGVDQQTGFLTRAVASVPIQINGQVTGVIEGLNPVSGIFGSDALDLLRSLGSLAATAIARAQWVADLQSAENRYAGLFEDSIDPILITDLEGNITDANRRAVEVFGYERDELVGQRITRVHRVGTSWLGSDRFRELRSGAPIRYETRITAKSTLEIPVEVYAKLVQRQGQEFIQWLQHDISERLAMEEMRNDLVSMIVHDLRSPLGNVMSSLEVVQSTLPPESEMEHSLLAIASRSALRLSRLVDSLLDLRRLESGQVTLNRDHANLNTLVAEAVEQVHATAEGKGVQIRFEVPPRLPYVSIDIDMIRRILINLLENAVKYMGGPGIITVVARAGPEEITLSVRDTGPGIPRSEHTRIFNRFARLKQESGPKGVGLGLAFCKLAVEAHGGRIWVESLPGRGAAFNFTLPLGD